MILLKIITLQIFWYLAISFGSTYQLPILFSSIIISIFNYFIYKPEISKGHYLFTLLVFVTYGSFQEWLFEYLKLVDYHQDNFPLWLTSLYFIFICYYGDLFNYLSKKSTAIQIVLGAIGGLSAYYGGVKLSNIEVISPVYYIAVSISWGLFFALSFKIFYGGFMWNKILDASLYYSFDKSGFLRHQKDFDDDYKFQAGTKAIITGGTSGIGQAASLEMVNQGAEVVITGRNQEKGEAAAKVHKNLRFIPWDMANWKEIPEIVESLEPLDFVVLNAGGMPDTFVKNEQGIELQFASQLFGHYYLIKELKDKGKLKKDSRIVWVTSGGMYLANLELNTIFQNPNYDKVKTYANVKRAQVTLLSFFKKEFSQQTITAMHPGWAETPGVSSAIPEFDKKMKGRLRSPLQGADSILWLLGTNKPIKSGCLYFDRKKVKKHFFWFTKSSDKKREKLIEILKSNI